MPYYEAQAFLFDMDGTIIDSHSQVDRAWSLWCARRGFELVEVLPHTRGVRTEDSMRMLIPHLDIAAEVAWIEAIEAGNEGIRVISSADQFLAHLPADRWAVVTSASKRVLEARFESCGLALPRTVVTAEMVSRGKPSPEPYLHAAEKLGVAPGDCIVFEDARAGMESALAAGCRVVLVGGMRSSENGVIASITDYAQLELIVNEHLLLGVSEASGSAHSI